MAEIIAVGATEVVSGEFTLNDGVSTVVNLKPASAVTLALPYDAVADVQLKTSDGGFVNLPPSLTIGRPAVRVEGPVTFRVVRRAAGGAYGVDKA